MNKQEREEHGRRKSILAGLIILVLASTLLFRYSGAGPTSMTETDSEVTNSAPVDVASSRDVALTSPETDDGSVIVYDKGASFTIAPASKDAPKPVLTNSVR